MEMFLVGILVVQTAGHYYASADCVKVRLENLAKCCNWHHRYPKRRGDLKVGRPRRTQSAEAHRCSVYQIGDD